MSESSKAVFLSYASQDAGAANKICGALRAAGVEVWFDQSELRGGDSWDQNIRKQIKECALFMPVVSANTQARREGYFRLEWKLADDRTHLMAKGTPFLVPVCVDDTKDWDALVPDSFMTVQWTRLPRGETTLKFCERVQALLRGEVAPARPRATAHPETSVSPATSTPSSQRKFPVWAQAAGAVVMIGAAVWFVTRLRPATSPSPPAANVSAPLRTASSSTAEIPRDPDLKRVMNLIFGLDAIPEDFALAEDILKPLVAARPNDPDVATISAVVAQEFLTRGFDVSQARRSSVQRLTERAAQLAPDNPDALAALGRYFVFIDAQMPRAEELLRRAIALRPDEPRYYRTLLGVLASRKPGAETEAFVAEMSARFPQAPLVRYDIARHYKDTNNIAGMERAMDETLALAPVSSAMVWKSWLALEAHGDGPGMKAWLDRVPERQRATTRVASAHAAYAAISGRAGEAIKMLSDLPDTWLSDFDFTGPKALLLGDALTIDGRKDLARLQYEAALAETQREEVRSPTDLRVRRAEMWALLGLGRVQEARTALQPLLQAINRPYRVTMNNSWWNGPVRAAFLLGERDPAVALLREAVTEAPSRMILRNQFHLDPRMAPWREDKEITALLAEPEKPKTENDGSAAAKVDLSAVAPAKVDEKSVAVLAFANLSDDKANEYFSDGISEELLNVLAKVPGLKVTARTSSFHFKGKDTSIPEIARQLGVAYVIEGSVRKAGSQVRITAQLIKATDGFHVWSDTFTRELKDVFAVQDEIAGLIAKKLSLQLGQRSAAAPVDPEAFRLLLAGRAKVRRGDDANRDAAIEDIRRAVALAPDYAVAWAELARVYIEKARAGRMGLEAAFGEARSAVRRAAALSPDAPEVLLAVGWVRRTADWDWRGAEEAFRRALLLHPAHPDVVSGAALLFNNLGYIDESLRLGRRAAELDPLNAEAHYNLSFFLGNIDQNVAAEAAMRRALALAPQADGYHRYLASTLADQGRLEEAARELAVESDAGGRLHGQALLLVRRGRNAEAVAVVRKLETEINFNTDRAEILALAGERDLAFAALALGYEQHDTGMIWLKVDSYLRNLHADPRWPTLLHKMGLADDQLK